MKLKRISVSVLVFLGIFFGVAAVGQKLNFNAILPSSSHSSQPISDEQQAILAVRKAKSSIVSVVGHSPITKLDAITVTAESSVAGTGFVLDSSGVVVTNNHVVEDSALIYEVILQDGTRYPAHVIGQDRLDDIALIKIDASGLIPASLGDSDALETGQTVFAIGNSLGRYQDTVTRGVISGLSRSVEGSSASGTPTMHNWIQTDAAINPGNSGGPLIDLTGSVVGMNTLIDTEGSALGFAIPINTIKDAQSQLKNFGTVSRPFLGLKFMTINPSVQTLKSLPVAQGALITDLVPASPAAQAGILAGDIIVAVNDHQLSEVYPLDEAVQKYQSGQQISVTILRSGQTLVENIILGQIK